MTPNEISHYRSLQKLDTENRKLIKKLQLDKEALKQQLILKDVSHQRELLEAFAKQIKEDNEFTEEITFQDINKCIASNCG